MKYYSTRNNEIVSASYAILNAFDKEGGLFIPEVLPVLNVNEMMNLTFQEIAVKILNEFFSEFTNEEIVGAVNNAYNSDNFSKENITEVITKNKYGYLELFHGNTYAFKDMALSLYPHLVKLALKKQNNTQKIYILTATSGDTGKAALEAVKDIEDIKIAVLYPEKGVSKIQKDQMRKQQGSNVEVLAIDGDFDDAQSYVKHIFNNQGIKDQFEEFGYHLMSANSINIARLLPQIIYYFDAYIKLVNSKQIKMNEFIDISVPTGNFGNILAAYFAKEMGLPIQQLVCASNSNNVLTDFLKKGIYDISDRTLKKTIAPSMDILISSNLERYLCLKLGVKRTRELMDTLNTKKYFQVSESELELLNSELAVSYANDDDIKAEIAREYNATGYVLDPHTATAKRASECYKMDNYQLIVATASPYKFADSIVESLKITSTNLHYYDDLYKHTKLSIPKKISELVSLKIRFNKVLQVKDVSSFLLNKLNHDSNHSFEVTVPATTANIGSGFDTIGIAMTLYNKFTFYYKKGFHIEGVDDCYNNKDNLVYRTYEEILKKYDKKISEDFNMKIDANVPISRGLGSSSTCIIAGIIAANIFGELNLTQDEILYEACLIEGHPDNVVPAVLGKMASAVLDDKKVYYQQIDVSNNLDFYAIIGLEELQTKKARAALPETLSYSEAIYNISRASILLNAFEKGIIEHLPVVTDDKLHQAYRLPLIKNIDDISEFFENDNFITYWVSGAGTTVMLLAQTKQRNNISKLIASKKLEISKLEVDNLGTVVRFL